MPMAGGVEQSGARPGEGGLQDVPSSPTWMRRGGPRGSTIGGPQFAGRPLRQYRKGLRRNRLQAGDRAISMSSPNGTYSVAGSGWADSAFTSIPVQPALGLTISSARHHPAHQCRRSRHHAGDEPLSSPPEQLLQPGQRLGSLRRFARSRACSPACRLAGEFSCDFSELAAIPA